MAKHLEKFIFPFRTSRIPFLLVEVVTDGQGAMVDLIFRAANAPACTLIGLPADAVQGKRFSRLFPAAQLELLAPLERVAFSGSSASFSYTTLLGRPLRVTCFQPMYGLVSCILEADQEASVPSPAVHLLDERLPGTALVLESGHGSIRCLSFSHQLCELTNRRRGELMNLCTEDFSALVSPADWPALLQALLDGARAHSPISHIFRLLCRESPERWVELRAQPVSRRGGGCTFYGLLLDVEPQLREQARQRETHRKTADTLSQLTHLLDHLPGGYCIFRQAQPDGDLEIIQLSQGLSTLLGYPVRELQRRLTADPLWLIPAADREALVSDAAQAREEGRELHRTCRVRIRGGDIRWMLVAVLHQPREDGSSALYVSCTDVSQEKAAQSELQFRSQLCDLLLDDPHLISFDYNPAADESRLFRFDSSGRRITKTIPDYLRSLENDDLIHPEDQRHLITAVKRASVRPTTDEVEYRGNYDGLGWRWYRISWISLFDNKGNVYRLVGKSEDITRRKAAAQRFRELKTLQKKPAPHTLLTAQLDLSSDRILDAKGSNRHLTEILFGNTADACLRHIRDQITMPEQREQFDRLFRRKPLLDAFHRGQLHSTLEHRFSLDADHSLFARTSVELIEDPETGHALAFCTVADVDSAIRQGALLTILAQRDYDLVLAVNTGTGLCRAYGSAVPDGSTYRSLAARFHRLCGEKAPRLETVKSQLEKGPLWECRLPAPHSGVARWSWLDQEDGLLLLTLQGFGTDFTKD